MRKFIWLIFGAFLVLCIGATVTSITTTNLKDLPGATAVFGTNQMVGLTNNTTARLFTVNQVSNAIRGAFGGGGGISVAAGTNVLLTTNSGLVTINGLTDTNIVELRARMQASNVVAQSEVWTTDGSFTYPSGTGPNHPDGSAPGPPLVIRKDGSHFYGTNVNQDVNELAFGIYRPSYAVTMVDSNEPAQIKLEGYAISSENYDFWSAYSIGVTANKDTPAATIQLNAYGTNGLGGQVVLQTAEDISLLALADSIGVGGQLTSGSGLVLNHLLYTTPSTNGSAGQALVTDGNTPQQLSWTQLIPYPTNSASDGQVVSATGPETKWISNFNSWTNPTSGFLQLSRNSYPYDPLVGGQDDNLRLNAGTIDAGYLYINNAASPNYMLLNGVQLYFPSAGPLSGQSLVTTGADYSGQLSWKSLVLSVSRSSDATSTSTTLATSGLSVTLVAGTTYTFQAQLFLSDSVAADGAKIDFNGGSATATTFIAQVTAFDTALNLSTQLSALDGAASASTFTGAGSFEVHGTIFVDAGGTFIPQFAQVAHTAGTLTLKKGSFLRVFQTN